MGKALRILTVFVLLLSIGALVFGILLFMKREELKGRTQSLERTLVEIAGYTENRFDDATPVEIPGRDMSDCPDRQIDNPEMRDFGSEYRHALEEAAAETINLGTDDKRRLLAQFYRPDPAGGKAKDPVTGMYISSGPGTMQEILTNLTARTSEQLNRLNETRSELKKTRMELSDVITVVNGLKPELRAARAEITDKKRIIAGLESDKSRLEGQVAQLEGEIADLKGTIVKKDEKIAELNDNIDDLNGKIKALQIELATHRATGPISVYYERIEPGQKGTVVSVNSRWKFVVMKLSREFLVELLGKDLDREVPPNFGLMIRRPGENGDLVTKVNLIQVKIDENLGIADILDDWQVHPVEEGDEVFY